MGKKSKHTRNPIKYLEPLTYHSEKEIEEQFREVYIEYYGNVTINNLGTKVYTKTGKFPVIYEDDYGYLGIFVGSSKNKVHHSHFLRLHRLVAMAFIANDNKEEKLEVNHIDLDKKNNCVTNLEWCTGLYNNHHARANGLMRGLKGSENGRSKLTEKEVQEIRQKYTGTKGEIAKLSREYNVSWALIKLIVTGKNWKHC